MRNTPKKYSTIKTYTSTQICMSTEVYHIYTPRIGFSEGSLCPIAYNTKTQPCQYKFVMWPSTPTILPLTLQPVTLLPRSRYRRWRRTHLQRPSVCLHLLLVARVEVGRRHHGSMLSVTVPAPAKVHTSAPAATPSHGSAPRRWAMVGAPSSSRAPRLRC